MRLQNSGIKSLVRYWIPPLTITSLLLIFSIGIVSRAAERIPPISKEASNTTPPPTVARDIAEIQRQLGGSIVANPKIFSPTQPVQPTMPTLKYPARHTGWDFPPRPLHIAPSPVPPKSPTQQKIELLRAAAAQLDITASQLERADLYTQADNLRDTAQDFRLEARKLRSQQTPSPTEPNLAP